MHVDVILFSALILGGLALLSAGILFWVSKVFHVYEDPRIALVIHELPGANCGGCGFAGCRGLAEAMVRSASLSGLRCPVGGTGTNTRIATILGVKNEATRPTIAVSRCQGSCAHAPAKSRYEGAPSCAFAASLFAGESACPNGCLGLGDCQNACSFNAISINQETRLPEINELKCVSCGACAKNCPRLLIEMRYKDTPTGRFYVACRNTEKGAVAKKNCSVTCIGCGKCAKTCPHQAITIENNLAYINDKKCIGCGSCLEACPTRAIRRDMPHA
ncbi:MAG: RnfABCDGE type electron transport complex subunit B [Bacteroidales bacterium]|nr:RnfABCDGE type electron transport complex subunit B [Bacteroidales bacterium]